jgi:hypothetical protein
MITTLPSKNFIIGGITGCGKTLLGRQILDSAIYAGRDIYLMTQSGAVSSDYANYNDYDGKVNYYWYPDDSIERYIDIFYQLSQKDFQENSLVLIDEYYPSLFDEDIFTDFAMVMKECNSQIVVVSQSLEMKIDLLSCFSYLATPKSCQWSVLENQVKTISNFSSDFPMGKSIWQLRKIKDADRPDTV